jgi:RNA polymerase sigma-70 factor (ECF subfamily)
MTSLFPRQNVKDLIAHAKQGDRPSLDAICNGLIPVVERMCRTRFPEGLKAKAGESDLVQESMLGAAARLTSLQGSNEADLVAWMEVIVENKAQDLRRRFQLAEKRNVSLEVSISHQKSSRRDLSLPDSPQAPLDKLISVEQSERLQQLVRRLPEHYQQIVWLRHRDGFSFPEIAICTNKSLPTVKNIYVRALKVLGHGIEGV